MTENIFENISNKLHYDSVNGKLFWKQTGKGRTGKLNIKEENIAGSIHKSGYMHVCVDGVHYRLHRVMWLLYYGEFPKGVIDHIDGNKLNNKISNLRDVSIKENNLNMRRSRVDSTTGFLGVCVKRKRFCARIRHEGKKLYLGTFDTPEEAHKVYLEHKRVLHNTCTI